MHEIADALGDEVRGGGIEPSADLILRENQTMRLLLNGDKTHRIAKEQAALLLSGAPPLHRLYTMVDMHARRITANFRAGRGDNDTRKRVFMGPTTISPVVTRLRCPPLMPRIIWLPTIVSAHTCTKRHCMTHPCMRHVHGCPVLHVNIICNIFSTASSLAFFLLCQVRRLSRKLPAHHCLGG